MKRMLFVISLLSVCVPSLADNDVDISAWEVLDLLFEGVEHHIQNYGTYPLGIVQEGDQYYFQDSTRRKGADITLLCVVLKEANNDELYNTVVTVKEELENEAPNAIRVLFSGVMPLSDEQINIMAALYVTRDVLKLFRGEDLSIKEDRCSERSFRSSILKKSDDAWLAHKRRNQDKHSKPDKTKQDQDKKPEPAHDTNVSNEGNKDIYEYIVSVDGPLNPFEW